MSTDTKAANRLTLICPNLTCRRTLTTPVKSRGMVMRCPYCDVPFRVPLNPPPAPPPPGAQPAGKR